MSGLDTRVQGLVLAMESGLPARIVKWSAFVLAVLTIAAIQLVVNFKGLSEPAGMEQATLARELASGNGFTTKSIRPLAMWQMLSNGREVPRVNFPETYHVPLNAMANAVPVRLARAHWAMDIREIVYNMDRVIAAVSVGFFLLSLIFWYLIARKLFDNKLAVLGTGLIIVCDLIWQFSLSGLPHMLLLLLFSAALYFLTQAVFARSSGLALGVWLSLYGVTAGLMAMTHPLSVWIFLGSMIFIAVYFRPRLFMSLLVVILFGLVVSPWLIRTYQVTGNPFGVAIFSLLDGVRGSENEWMGRLDPGFSGLSFRAFQGKLEENAFGQLGNLLRLLGLSVVAPVFFLSLLHSFRMPERSHVRWLILLMWLGAFLGMTIFGWGGQPVAQNQLHVLFIPMFTYYGLAFLLVLWSRLPIDYRVVRIGFFIVLYLLCSTQLILSLMPFGKSRLHWPPYVPPYIGMLGTWFQPEEIIASDMPWAVGWYANRKSLLLPESPQDLVAISDYNQLGGPVNGLYLTPITGRLGFFNEIARGPYQPWAPFILRSPNLQNFPLQAATALPIDNECILYANSVRWQQGQTEADTEALTGQAPEEPDAADAE